MNIATNQRRSMLELPKNDEQSLETEREEALRFLGERRKNDFSLLFIP